MDYFEDSDGLLPIHNVGATATGLVPNAGRVPLVKTCGDFRKIKLKAGPCSHDGSAGRLPQASQRHRGGATGTPVLNSHRASKIPLHGKFRLKRDSATVLEHL